MGFRDVEFHVYFPVMVSDGAVVEDWMSMLDGRGLNLNIDLF